MTYRKYDGSAAVQTTAPVSDQFTTDAVETLTGTSAHESLWLGQGDTGVGAGGDDTISGGSGADTFHSFAEAGVDLVLDFNFAEGDRVNLVAGTTYSYAQVGADVVVNMGPGASLILQNVQMSSLGEGWIIG